MLLNSKFRFSSTAVLLYFIVVFLLFIFVPILTSAAIILLLGVCLFNMLQSVRHAEKLFEQSEDVDLLLEKAEKIRWNNVRILAQKSLTVKGKTLYSFQNSILDAQHDICKILDAIDRTYKDAHNKSLTHHASAIRGIMQRLVIEARTSDDLEESLNIYREIDTLNMSSFLHAHFPDCKIQNTLPHHCKIPVSDISLFERILINLASNIKKHAIRESQLKLFYENNFCCLRVYSSVSKSSLLKIIFARWTKRIDTKNPKVPVYFKLFGRTGRGLSIVKRGILKLGGNMIFSLLDGKLEIGFNIPAFLDVKPLVKSIKMPARKRVIFFNNEEFLDRSIECGLKKYLVTKTELSHLIKKARKEERLEVVSDENIDLPEPCILKLVTKKERIEGIAVNWMGENRC